jgi:hypothetical protein
VAAKKKATKKTKTAPKTRKPKRRTKAEKAAVLKRIAKLRSEGRTVPEACKEVGLAVGTYGNWASAAKRGLDYIGQRKPPKAPKPARESSELLAKLMVALIREAPTSMLLAEVERRAK